MIPKFSFAIDRGGTFTDVFALCPGGKIKVAKLLSDDPSNYSDAPTEGIRRILEEVTGEKYERNLIDSSKLNWIRMGTTVATNALLERKGERIALVITEGFKDLLKIGNQSRPNIFSLEISCFDTLYEDVVEVEERVVLKKSNCQLKHPCHVETGTTAEEVEIWTPVNKKKLVEDLKHIHAKGITSLAVVLMHSYTYAENEAIVGKIAEDIGFSHISLSSQVMPMVRIVPRGHTACVDAYLTPCIKKYVASFSSGFENKLKGVNVLFMQSDGGLTPMNLFCGSRAILSGPAGGVVGYSKTTYNKYSNLPVIGFDMGGTSTDVSRYDGNYDHVYDATVAGVNVQAPQLAISTVAAGGGSMLFFRSGLFVVGPDSAGAHPGPVCYRKGGPLTVTDANLCLGRLQPKYFPKIFGKTENLPLDKDASYQAFDKMTTEINSFRKFHENTSKELSVEEVALGFIRVANEAMSRPIRSLTQGKGFDPSQHVLSCFGGAGSQHACSIAKALGISTIFVHKYAGILSAFGMALADVVYEAQEACAEIYCSDNFGIIDSRIDDLSSKCIKNLEIQGFDRSQISMQVFLNLRYEKTDCSIMCTPEPPSSESCKHGDFRKSFIDRYEREFGFSISDRPIEIDDIRVRGVANQHYDLSSVLPQATDAPQHETVMPCYFENGYEDTRIYLLENLGFGHEIRGPAIIIDANCTILIEPDCVASITKDGSVLIKIVKNEVEKVSTDLDMIQLSIFSHRFMSIAEQMGKILQRTSISTNIKERLDFSCALFGPDGGLVSNAPHIPVHLGAMQVAVQFQVEYNKTHKEPMVRGDVFLSNHPAAGGSHLPDLTVITPVFYSGLPDPVFFVACRGHHADIGGLTPGSMPPHSTSLLQEGALFISLKLVSGGVFQEEEITKALNEPSKYPGCSGTRNLKDNLADLKAQIAANQKGIALVEELIRIYGVEVVQSYMKYIQQNAELAVRGLLKQIGSETLARTGQTSLMAQDHMDDGSPIRLAVIIDVEQGSAVFDFTGTGHEVHGNWNTPRAVCLSAVIYCLRCMVGHDIPLNQGCLLPVEVVTPRGCLLCPSDTAAVVGGNVLTSQRIVDVILKAFGACADSQGCMNNVTFGDETVGYYETVAGGAGAGPHWHGRSGVHTHMTNTRITDPEILERRYPVVLEQFHLNPETGGRGLYNGGDGVVRKMLFRKDLTLSVLTERRVFAPHGLEGGEDGARGQNLLIRKDGRIINLGAKTTAHVSAGDSFLLKTPGGGGYGKRSE